MGTLPMDIIHTCILPRLPAKSLLRFKCVSKSFESLISSPEFIRLHHTHALSSDANCLLLVPGPREACSLFDLDSSSSSSSFGTPPMVCRYPRVPTKDFSRYDTIAAWCECFILLGEGYTQLDRLALLNPITRSLRELPYIDVPGNSVCVYYGLCHDEANDDFKVLRIVNYVDRQVMIYSLRSNSWTLIDNQPIVDDVIQSSRRNDFAIVKGHLFNFILWSKSSLYGTMRIACFDIKAEAWAPDVDLPDFLINADDTYPRFMCYHMGLFDGCLLYMMVEDRLESTCDVWVMKEYGVKDSWAKLMGMPVATEYYHGNWLLSWQYVPLAYRKGSQIEILCLRDWRRLNSKSELFWYNLSNNQATQVDNDFLQGPDFDYSLTIFVCKGSLMNIPGGRQIDMTYY